MVRLRDKYISRIISRRRHFESIEMIVITVLLLDSAGKFVNFKAHLEFNRVVRNCEMKARLQEATCSYKCTAEGVLLLSRIVSNPLEKVLLTV